MEKYWKFLSVAYVTEESDDPDNPNGLIEHKLEWTSDSNFLNVLSVLAKKKLINGIGKTNDQTKFVN